MSNKIRRLLSVALALAMLFALSVPGFAAAEKALLTMTAKHEAAAGEVVVAIDATTKDVVADGKLTVSYDAEMLTFMDVQAGAAWPENADLSLQANPAREGAVVIAFAGVEAAAEGTVLTLHFAAKGEGETTVSLDAENSYITDADDYSLEAEVKAVVECPSARFVDLDPDKYYHEGIDYVLNKGYMIGMNETQFGPKVPVNRAMVVVVLHRMAGEPQATAAEPFADVDEDDYYYDAVAWAAEVGIAKGMTETVFGPKLEVTREQMVVFFARFAEFCGVTVEAKGDLSAYTDADQVGSFAVESMTWAVEVGLIKGMSETKLGPKGNTLRAQLAVVIHRFATAILD